MLIIDGSTLEGGGQLTRLALGLSAITSTPLRIHSIRAGRSALRRHQENSKTPARESQPKNPRNASGRAPDKITSRNGHASAPVKAAGGLKDSHLAALEFLAEHCGARVEGAHVGSPEVVFRPHPPRLVPESDSKKRTTKAITPVSRQREFTIELSKPGSVWLIFQAVLPFLIFGTDWSSHASSEKTDSANLNTNSNSNAITLTLKGGTNASKAMTTEYVSQVFLPIATLIGLPPITITPISRGWAGNAPAIGTVQITIHAPNPNTLSPTGRFTLQPFTLRIRGDLSSIDITIIADPPSTRETLANTLTTLLQQTFPSIPINVLISDPSADDRRLYILLVAHTTTHCHLAADYIGGGGRARNPADARRKLEEACVHVTRDLRAEVLAGGCVDSHLADQLVVFQALADGVSVVKNGGSSSDGVDVDKNGEKVDVDRESIGIGDESGTLHTRTVRWVCETMLPDYGVEFRPGGLCTGIGWNGHEFEKKRRRTAAAAELDVGVGNLHIDAESESDGS